MRGVSGVAGRIGLGSALRWLQSPRSRWSAPVQGAIAATAMTAAWLTLWPQQYTATGRIVVDPSAAGSSATAEEWIATQAEIVRSDRVASRVAADLPESGWRAVQPLAHLSVEPSAGSGVIAVRYASADPFIASRVADAVVAEYERVTREMRAASLAAIKDGARARLAELREEAEQAQLKLETIDRMQGGVPSVAKAVQLANLGPLQWSGLPGEHKAQADSASVLANAGDSVPSGPLLDPTEIAPGVQDAQAELERARRALGVAQARMAQLEGDDMLERPTMSVLNRARDSVQAPILGTLWLYTLAALSGLAAGWILRFLARRIDRRVVDPQDLARAGLAVFGVLIDVADPPKSARVIAESARRSWPGRADAAPALS
jgi:capsular polysaccharide biosynthesis protein